MKDIDYYLSLPYTIELLREDETTWFARVRELPGCMTEGDSPADALEMIQDAMRGWLEVSIEDGDSIPEPRPEEDYSGKFVVRVARSLHRDLVETAEREGVSLNQYIGTELARAVGRQVVAAEPAASVSPTAAWPGLQAGMKQVLVAAGRRQEAGALDEHLFASWLQTQMAQVQAAVKKRDPGEAGRCLDAVRSALASAESPMLVALLQMVEMTVENIGEIHRLQGQVLDSDRVYQRAMQTFREGANAAYAGSSSVATGRGGSARPELKLIRGGSK